MSDKNIKQLFGGVLRTWRTRRGFTQHELAQRADMQRSYISEVERGERNTSLQSIKKLADALNISPQRLFKFETVFAAGKMKKTSNLSSP